MPSPPTGSVPAEIDYQRLDQVMSAETIHTVIGLFFDYVGLRAHTLHTSPDFSRASRIRTRSLRPSVLLARTDGNRLDLGSGAQTDRADGQGRSRGSGKKVRQGIQAEDGVHMGGDLVWLFSEMKTDIQAGAVSNPAKLCEGIVWLVLGLNTAHVIVNAQAMQFAMALRLNEESLLFQADKSAAITRGRVVALRQTDARGLQLPSEVDDEYITESGMLAQPTGVTPQISGFNVTSVLFMILEDALALQRKGADPTVDAILADLEIFHRLRSRIDSTLSAVAPALKITKDPFWKMERPDAEWKFNIQQDLHSFLHENKPRMPVNSFLVMQANILVTSQLVRLVLLHTQGRLLERLAFATQTPIDRLGGHMEGCIQTSDFAEDLTCELLDGLHSLPIECVAVNGPSCVQKIRFVASHLLDNSAVISTKTARAKDLLMEFLRILSVIESMYNFDHDVSAE
ncbi:hypothetical protein P7C73_g5576, partial [Tremellales sp. Uapishka_1]